MLSICKRPVTVDFSCSLLSFTIRNIGRQRRKDYPRFRQKQLLWRKPFPFPLSLECRILQVVLWPILFTFLNVLVAEYPKIQMFQFAAIQLWGCFYINQWVILNNSLRFSGLLTPPVQRTGETAPKCPVRCTLSLGHWGPEGVVPIEHQSRPQISPKLPHPAPSCQSSGCWFSFQAPLCVINGTKDERLPAPSLTIRSFCSA